MADCVEPGDEVVLDVTHGLRHLPMIALASALYLRSVRGATIEGIYYGAFDLTEHGVTPVLRLEGLLSIADWVEAFHAFGKDGDYSVFTELLAAEGLEPSVAARLTEAAFHERTQHVGRARGPLAEVDRALAAWDAPPIGALFRPLLAERIGWYREPSHYRRQRALAVFHLENGDYIRAAILGCEAFLTSLVQARPGLEVGDFEARETVRQEFRARENPDPRRRPYLRLADIRNAPAHGVRSSRKNVQQALRDRESLEKALRGLFRELLPAQ